MQNYCVICRKSSGNKDAKVIKTRNGIFHMKSHCTVCANKKSRFVFKKKDLQPVTKIMGKTAIRAILSYFKLLLSGNCQKKIITSTP